MNKEDYFKYYIQGSDHYLIPKDVFIELFEEMENWKEESKELNQKYLNAVADYETTMSELQELKKENKILKENAENNDKVVDKVNWENQLLKKENKQLKDKLSKIETLIINHNCDTGDIYYKYNSKFLKSELKQRILEIVYEEGSDSNE